MCTGTRGANREVTHLRADDAAAAEHGVVVGAHPAHPHVVTHWGNRILTSLRARPHITTWSRVNSAHSSIVEVLKVGRTKCCQFRGTRHKTERSKKYFFMGISGEALPRSRARHPRPRAGGCCTRRKGGCPGRSATCCARGDEGGTSVRGVWCVAETGLTAVVRALVGTPKHWLPTLVQKSNEFRGVGSRQGARV